MPEGEYAMIASGGRTIGGYLETPEGRAARGALADAPARGRCEGDLRRRSTSLGGKMLKPAFKVGDFGTMAIVGDPHGGVFALWQPAKLGGAARADDEHVLLERARVEATRPRRSRSTTRSVASRRRRWRWPTGHVSRARGGWSAARRRDDEDDARSSRTRGCRTSRSRAPTRRPRRRRSSARTVIVPPTDVPNVGRFSDPRRSAGRGYRDPAARRPHEQHVAVDEDLRAGAPPRSCTRPDPTATRLRRSVTLPRDVVARPRC